MASETELSGVELDEAIALAMGWVRQDEAHQHGWTMLNGQIAAVGYVGGHYHDADGEPASNWSLPSWHSSVDELIRGPEARLRAAGLHLRSESFWTDDGMPAVTSATWYGRPRRSHHWTTAMGDTEAEARARAALQALRVLQRKVV